jgi:predicted PurR-regulated permease PerM
VLWLARNILAPFIIAAVLAYAFTPVMAILTRRSGMPRLLVVVVTYLVAVGVLIGLFVWLGGRLVTELQTLQQQGANAIAYALHQLLGRDSLQIGDTQISVTSIARQLQEGLAGLLATPGDALHLAGQVLDVALQAILTLIVTFYLLVDGARFWHFALGFVPAARRSRVTAIGDRIHIVLGRWLRGQLILIALVAVVVYLLLGPILHVPYALAIAVLTGFLEVIPLIGPLLAATIAAVVALSSGGTGLAIAVIVTYVVLRQIEDQLVMPLLIGRAVHLHPVVTIFSVLVGLSAWGVLGGLLAVPVAAALNVALRELYPPDDPAPEAT